MAKVLKCRDLGFDCNAVVRTQTEEEALKQVAQHAKDVHNLTEITPEVMKKVKAALHDE